jgi:DNA-binding LytR/AlgR family response regulator
LSTSIACTFVAEPIILKIVNQSVDLIEFSVGHNPQKTAEQIKRLNLSEIYNASNINPQIAYPQKVFINNGKHLVGIEVDNIAYCKANRDFTNVITIDNKTYLSNKGISALELHLNPSQFIRIHRSFLINLKHTLLISNEFSRYFFNIQGVEIPVSRNYVQKIKQLIF